MEYQHITAPEFAEMEGLDDWRFALGAIRAEFAVASFPAATPFLHRNRVESFIFLSRICV